MNEEDIATIRQNYAQTVQRWELIKSAGKADVEVYRNDISESMVACNSYEEHAEKMVSQAKDMLTEAKKMRRNLAEREESAKRLFWLLKNGEPVTYQKKDGE